MLVQPLQELECNLLFLWLSSPLLDSESLILKQASAFIKQDILLEWKARKSFNFIAVERFSFSMMKTGVSVLSAMEGVNAGLGRVSVKLFFWLCSRFPLEGISLRLCNKTLYKEPIFNFIPYQTSLALGAQDPSQAPSGGTERSILESFSHKSSNLKCLGRCLWSLEPQIYFGWCLQFVSSSPWFVPNASIPF